MSDATRLALQRAVRAERARAGISQEELARRLGWSRTTLADVEQGRRKLGADELPDLCKALGSTLDSLYHRAPDDERTAMGL